MVDHPEPVMVSVVQEDDRTVYQLSVHKNDLGKVIGKKGRTAKAMRTLLQAVAGKEGQAIHLEIMDPIEPEPTPSKAESVDEPSVDKE